MKILILTYGTRGDVQPYVALGRSLERVGHRVTVAAPERFADFVRTHGLHSARLNDELLAMMDTDEGRELVEKGGNLFQMARRGWRMAKRLKPVQQALLRESWQAAESTQPDFIVFHPKAAGAPHIAEKLGVDCVLATPVPMLQPTGAWPCPVFPDPGLGRWYNRLTYRLAEFATNRGLKTFIAGFRDELELPPLQRYEYRKTADGRSIPILHAHSAAVLPRPSDWPQHARVTGYWFLDSDSDWSPPQNLQDFLEAGPPPVYVGFGSMAGRNPERLAKIVIEALELAGLRGVLATGRGGMKTAELPDTILPIDQAPHDWLFPRMAAVVHHGGAGSTAAGLRAGRPTIIVPFFADQPFWGGCVRELGAGPAPLSLKKLTPGSLAAALREATGNRTMRATAEEIGREIRAENGAENAVRWIEHYAARASRR